MYSFLSRYGQLIALGLGAFITIIFFAIIGASGSTFSDLADQDLPLRQYNAELSKFSMFNFGIVATGLLILVCAAATLVFGVLNIVTDFKSYKKVLIGAGVLLAIFIALYFVSSSSGDSDSVLAVIDKMNKKSFDDLGNPTINTVTAGRSSYISASIITTAILGLLALISMVAFEVWNLFR
ncbi:MAG: hypothetical protein ACI94Y_001909 [Maribacter sp.]|jgi:hypothetical protein